MVDFDVAIIGAGPAGSACATFLARQGRRVALVDRAHFPRDKVCGDGITPRGARLLERLGALAPVAAVARAHRGVLIRGGAGQSLRIPFGREPVGASDLLVIPRLVLDAILVEHARAAGAAWFPGEKVVNVNAAADGRLVVETAAGALLGARLVVVATGADTQLLRRVGVLERKPALEHAARVYFEDVSGLDDHVTLFFDGVDMPGYGWIFPTGPRSANIGCGAFTPHAPRQAARLEQLLREHRLLRPMLEGARQAAPVRAYPLRTDFAPAHASAGPIACVGEAAGLVNPITGEGIDYALESAGFLADAVEAHWPAPGEPVDRVLSCYRRLLKRRFALRFRVYHWLQRHCLQAADSREFFTLVEGSPALRKTVVDGLFGRVRMRDCLHPALLVPGVKLAWLSRNAARGLPVAPVD